MNFKISDDALRRVKGGRDFVDKVVREKRGQLCNTNLFTKSELVFMVNIKPKPRRTTQDLSILQHMFHQQC